MQRFLLPVVRSLGTRLFLVLLLPFLCAACIFGGDNASPQTPPPQQQKQAESIPTPSTGIRLGAQTCPDTVKDAVLWQPSIALDADQSVEHVLCGNLLGIPTLQAVVLVRHIGSDALLDVFVYTDITSIHPTAVFSVKGLMHGDAEISGYNTLLTAQEDPNSLYNTMQVGQWTVDLYHEYKWSDTAKSLIQIPFSGIFPDLTRYQAETAQIMVNNGRDEQQWRLSALLTVQHFAVNLLHWPSNTPATIVKGGGPGDIHAIVQIQQPTSSLITVLLDRLELNANGGIWEVVDVQDDGLTLTSPNTEPLTSPITVNGNATATAGTVGTIEVLDHLYKESGKNMVWVPTVTGPITFSKPLPFIVSFKGGTQEGTIMFSVSNTLNGMITKVALAKVLLSA